MCTSQLVLVIIKIKSFLIEFHHKPRQSHTNHGVWEDVFISGPNWPSTLFSLDGEKLQRYDLEICFESCQCGVQLCTFYIFVLTKTVSVGHIRRLIGRCHQESSLLDGYFMRFDHSKWIDSGGYIDLIESKRYKKHFMEAIPSLEATSRSPN